MKHFLITGLFVLLLCTGACAQWNRGLYIGYNVGTYFNPMRNLQNVAYAFNVKYGDNVVKPMAISNIYQGVDIGYHFMIYKFGMEINWSNKHTISTGKRLDNGEERTVALKSRINTLNGGVHFPVTKRFSMGFGMNLGTFKIKKKDALSKEFGAAEYENFYTENAITSALTLYALKSVYIAGGSGILFKPFFEWYYIAPEMAYGPNRKYAFRTTNIGITTAINLGSKSDE